MPRSLRIVDRDTHYHVINRGNYRRIIFESEGARYAFGKALDQSCRRFGWQVQAYCLMQNHFHICLRTPIGNLSEGMAWLQGTFAARFNRYRAEQGRLFQGRFKSLLVEPGQYLLNLVDYIHLNPLHGGLVGPDGLRAYTWSSLAEFPRISTRPSWLDASWMDYAERLTDTRSGWRAYRAGLQARVLPDTRERKKLDRAMSWGWCLGSKEFKKTYTMDLRSQPEVIRLEGDQIREFNKMRWEEKLTRCLNALGLPKTELPATRKSDPRKVAIATHLRQTTSATNGWLSQQLFMGTPGTVSAYCGLYERKRKKTCPFAKKLNIER